MHSNYLYGCVILHVKRKKLSILNVFIWFLKMATMFGDVTAITPPPPPPSPPLYLRLKENNKMLRFVR